MYGKHRWDKKQYSHFFPIFYFFFFIWESSMMIQTLVPEIIVSHLFPYLTEYDLLALYNTKNKYVHALFDKYEPRLSQQTIVWPNKVIGPSCSYVTDARQQRYTFSDMILRPSDLSLSHLCPGLQRTSCLTTSSTTLWLKGCCLYRSRTLCLGEPLTRPWIQACCRHP